MEQELPSVILRFGSSTYSLFSKESESDTRQLYFGSDYIPETIDIPCEEESPNSVLFDSPLFFFILEIKNILNIRNDAILEIPLLDLVLHQDLYYLRKISPFQIYNYYIQLQLSKGINPDEIVPLEITLIEVICY
jgi:hypothetical protein